MSTVVVKLGGAALQNPVTLEKLTLMVKQLQCGGSRPVIIHGGGPAINQELTSRGITWTFINGQRQTTAEMMGVIEEVLGTQVNRLIVDALTEAGLSVKGFSGGRDQLFYCTKVSAELGLVGKVEEVNISVLKNHPDIIPVIAPIGLGAFGEKYNINADWAAAKLAVALGAEKLIFLTDQNGILDSEGDLVDLATADLIHEMIDSGVIHGGMYTKVVTMMSALDSGVEEVQVMNALAAHQYGQLPLGTRLVEIRPLE
jgi:acetylglutamate kinase